LKEVFLKFLKASWPISVLVLLVCIFFYPIFQGKVPLPGDFVVGVYFPWLDYKWGYPTGVPVKNPMTTDVVSFIYPMQMLAVDMLKSGQWPLWNPYILAGTPLLANFQSAPFSPTNFVYWIFDRLTAWSVQIMLQHLTAGLFTYLLLRHWKVTKLPSLLGGAVYAFAGFNLIWSQWNGHALSAAFIPLLLLLTDLWFGKPRLLVGVFFSLVVALQILSGYPQVVFYTILALAILWLFHFRRDVSWLFSSVVLSVFGILGLGLSAFQILPGKELLDLSQREVEPHPFEWAFLPLSKAITFFAPDYYGNHSTQNYWGPQDYTSNTGFVGIVPTVFASLAVCLWKTRREVKFLFVLLFASLILAFPTPVSIFFWKSGWFGLNAASAHRSLVLFNLSVALLVGFGADTFWEKKAAVVKAYIVPSLTIVGFFIFTLAAWRLSDVSSPAYAHSKVGLRNLIWPGAVLVSSFLLLWWGNRRTNLRRQVAFGLVLLVALAELFRFGWKFTPFSPRNIVFPTTPVLDYLQNQEKPFRTTGSRVIPINMRMPYKIETMEGYDAVYPLEISQFIAAITSKKSGTAPVGRYGTIGDETERVLDLVSVKYDVVVKRNKENQPDIKGVIPAYFDQKQFPIVFEDRSVAILENKNVLPRAFMVYDYESSSGPKTLDKMLSADFPQDKKILLEDSPSLKIEKGGSSQILYTVYKETESELGVSTNQNGLLFISDTFYPGWKAYVDGVEKKILQADYAFRAVEVPKGTHEVKFSYKPESFFLGLWAAGVSFFILALWLGINCLGNRPKE